MKRENTPENKSSLKHLLTLGYQQRGIT